MINKRIACFNYCLQGDVTSKRFQLTSVKGSIDSQLTTRKPFRSSWSEKLVFADQSDGVLDRNQTQIGGTVWGRPLLTRNTVG